MKMNKNSRMVLFCLVLLGIMGGLTASAVPIYRLFCQVTGYGGTTQRAEGRDLVAVGDREFHVRFDSTVQPDLPWTFHPEQKEVALKVGENRLIYYKAVNNSDKTITGQAVFNVTPAKAGPYFVKIECFCFTEQTLKPGEAVDMPVTFYIDPQVGEDPNMGEVKTITLSYTFFEKKVEDNADKDGSLAAASAQRTGGSVTN